MIDCVFAPVSDTVVTGPTAVHSIGHDTKRIIQSQLSIIVDIHVHVHVLRLLFSFIYVSCAFSNFMCIFKFHFHWFSSNSPDIKYQCSRDALPWLQRLDSDSINQSGSNDPLIKPQLVREIGWKIQFLVRTYIDASGVVQDRGSGSWFRFRSYSYPLLGHSQPGNGTVKHSIWALFIRHLNPVYICGFLQVLGSG